jgi:zinc finger HIT domain-containing protein 1
MPTIEVLQTAASAPAPGWAYVLDRAVDPSKTAINPSGSRNTKRIRTQTHAPVATDGSELTRREAVAIERRLAELQKDGGKDIDIPAKWRVQHNAKLATNVRRVLGSEKTFMHHVEDEEAARALRATEGAVSWRSAAAVAARKADAKKASAPGPAQSSAQADEDDENPLLQSNVPLPPTAEEIEALLSAPALSWTEARVAPPLPPSKGGPPQRHFCEICGYWGRVRCLKCGSRVCALECKNAHDQDCKQRFA